MDDIQKDNAINHILETVEIPEKLLKESEIKTVPKMAEHIVGMYYDEWLENGELDYFWFEFLLHFDKEEAEQAIIEYCKDYIEMCNSKIEMNNVMFHKIYEKFSFKKYFDDKIKSYKLYLEQANTETDENDIIDENNKGE